jgi:hypothetical protein
LTIAGPVSLHGAGVTINSNIDTRTGGANGDVLVKSSVDITLAPTKSIKTTGGDVVLWSNSDAQKTDGTILLSNGSSVATGSGHVWLGGGSGSTSWNGLTVGDGYAVPNTNAINSASGALRAGIIFDVSSVQTSGGNIAINAMSGTTTIGAISTHGVNTLDAGNGTLYIKTRNIDNAGRGLLTGMYNSTVAAQTTFKSTHTGSDAIVIDVDVSNGLATGLGTSVEGNTRILAPNGDIRITSIAATGQSGLRMGYSSTSVGTLQVLSGSGDILLNTGSTSIETANASSTITLGYVSGDTLVPSSVSNIKFVSDKFSSNGALVFNTSGTLVIEPFSQSFSTDFNTTSLNYSADLSGLTIGKSGNASGITIGSAANIAGPVTVYGGAIAINAPVTSTGTVKLTGSTITDGAGGVITADKLAILSGAVTLDNTSNAVNTLEKKCEACIGDADTPLLLLLLL